MLSRSRGHFNVSANNKKQKKKLNTCAVRANEKLFPPRVLLLSCYAIFYLVDREEGKKLENFCENLLHIIRKCRWTNDCLVGKCKFVRRTFRCFHIVLWEWEENQIETRNFHRPAEPSRTNCLHSFCWISITCTSDWRHRITIHRYGTGNSWDSRKTPANTHSDFVLRLKVRLDCSAADCAL